MVVKPVGSLQSLVRGRVVTRADASYDEVRAVHNGAVDARPEAIVQVSGLYDVKHTVRFARTSGRSLSVRAGGHGVVGNAVRGDVVIDLSALRAVTVDPVARTAVVRGGATWGDVDAATQAHGLAVPGGRISGTGVGGLTLGGGEGWLSCKHGLSSDNLVAAELVTADGSTVVVREDTAPELFWALRGGGGNFGVVTAFTFRLHPVRPLVLAGMLGYPLSAAPEVLATLAELHAAGEEDFAGAAAFRLAPPAPFVPGDLVGTPIIAVIPTWFGEPEAGKAFLAPLRERVRPVVDAVAPMPYVALQSMLDAGSPKGMRNRWSGALVPELGPALAGRMQRSAMRLPGPLSQILISPLPDAVRRLPDDATAFPGRSGGRWMVHPVAVWADATRDDEAAAWVAELTAAVRANGETGSYLNLDEPDDARIRWAMGDERYRRLQRVKAAWDPDDVFRHCTHIELPGNRGPGGDDHSG
jgi:FAD/FMN-containing dehydrogenase